jgi:hypothetical protein
MFHSPQPSFDFYTSFDMSATSPALDVPIVWADSGSAEMPLRCRFPDCSHDLNFLTESALQKHEAKHIKPYVCQVPGCKYPHFGDKGGLDRHTREVHGSKTYCCPVALCKRNTIGFARKYNLFEHQKRCHPGQSLSTTLALNQKSQSLASFDREGTEGGRCSDGEASPPEITIIGDVARTGGRRLREELERLCALRAELDSDIAALKRTLDIFGDASS